jgi:hypothetical protein
MVTYLPANERVEIIRSYARQYNTRVFIETGTSIGDTVAALVNEFDVLNTIEIDPGLYRDARSRFARYAHVNCLLGDSGIWLCDLVPYLVDPVLFWLDGHYCGGPGRGEIDTPIRTELIWALQAPPGSVILIDDARLFEGMSEHTEEFKDYPSIHWVEAVAAECNYNLLIQDDIMRLTQ